MAKLPFLLDRAQLTQIVGMSLRENPDGRLMHVSGPSRWDQTSRLLLGLDSDDGRFADFRNRDWRDLRSENLRVTVVGDTCHDHYKRLGLTSPFYNVYVVRQGRRRRVRARPYLKLRDGTRVTLGSFDDEADAARLINYITLQVRGTCGSYNDPNARRGGLRYDQFRQLMEIGADVLPVSGSDLERMAERKLQLFERKYGVHAVASAALATGQGEVQHDR